MSLIDQIKQRASLVETIRAAGVDLRRKGRELVAVCPFHSEKSGSFTVNPDKGFYHCFGCGAHGDVIDFVRADRAIDAREAVRQLAAELNLSSERLTPEEQARAAAERQARRDAAEAEERRRADWMRASAGEIWQAASHDVRVGIYLRARGIDTDAIGAAFGEMAPGGVPLSLRFHAACPDFQNKRTDPAMVGAIVAGGDERRFTGIHRTFLAPGLAVKRAFDAKMMMAGAWGGVVRLTGASARLVIGEGIETTLAVMSSLAKARAVTSTGFWAGLSLGNIGGRGFGELPDLTDRGIILPAIVDELIIAEDADNKDQRSADRIYARAAARYARRGRRVLRARPRPGMDFSDMLVAA